MFPEPDLILCGIPVSHFIAASSPHLILVKPCLQRLSGVYWTCSCAISPVWAQAASSFCQWQPCSPFNVCWESFLASVPNMDLCNLLLYQWPPVFFISVVIFIWLLLHATYKVTSHFPSLPPYILKFPPVIYCSAAGLI